MIPDNWVTAKPVIFVKTLSVMAPIPAMNVNDISRNNDSCMPHGYVLKYLITIECDVAAKVMDATDRSGASIF